MVDPPTCLSCTIRSLTSTEPKDPIQLQPTLETQFSSNLHLRVETQVEAKPAVVLSDQVIPAGTQASILKCSKAKKPYEVNKQKKVIASRLRRKWGVHCALANDTVHCEEDQLDFTLCEWTCAKIDFHVSNSALASPSSIWPLHLCLG